MARIVEAAWRASNEWGLYVWLSAVTGARWGEVIALRSSLCDHASAGSSTSRRVLVAFT